MQTFRKLPIARPAVKKPNMTSVDVTGGCAAAPPAAEIEEARGPASRLPTAAGTERRWGQPGPPVHSRRVRDPPSRQAWNRAAGGRPRPSGADDPFDPSRRAAADAATPHCEILHS